MTGIDALDKVRRSSTVRIGATILVVAALIVAGVLFNERITGQDKTLTAVSSILARTCGTTTFDELERQGLVEECRLAQDGDLVAEVADADDLPAPTAKPDEVDPDVIKDDPNSTPADISPAPNAQVSTQQIDALVRPAVQEAVGSYFAANPLPSTDGYQRAIRRATVQYLSANPPEPGPAPTTGQVQDAVRVVLSANPPQDGTDGADGSNGEPGRGVATASVNGCDVVFAFTDGTTQRVGPLCGEDGEPGSPATDAQVAEAVAAYCTANGACRGPAGPAGVVQTSDNCQPAPGEFVVDVSISGPEGDPATITLTCETAATGLLGGSGGDSQSP